MRWFLTKEMLIWDFLEKKPPGDPEMKAETLVGVGGRHPVLGARELSGSEEEMEPESMGTGPGHIARQAPEWSSFQSRTSPSLTEAASFSKCSRGLINSAPSPENPEPGWQAGG